MFYKKINSFFHYTFKRITDKKPKVTMPLRITKHGKKKKQKLYFNDFLKSINHFITLVCGPYRVGIGFNQTTRKGDKDPQCLRRRYCEVNGIHGNCHEPFIDDIKLFFWTIRQCNRRNYPGMRKTSEQVNCSTIYIRFFNRK